jgi:hypothetical protein
MIADRRNELESSSLRIREDQSGLRLQIPKWQTDETNRMSFNNLIGHPAYETEHLNLGKHIILTKRIRFSFAASVRHPSPFVKTNANPTKRIVCTLTTESAGHNCPTHEKELPNSRKQVILTERITAASLMLFPPMTGREGCHCESPGTSGDVAISVRWR